MHSPEHCFTQFNESVLGYSLPERFTFPFYYQPHPLCVLAAQELQVHLQTQADFQHDFGVGETQSDTATGKMFGVLLVKSRSGELGYLSAFSGKIADQNLWPKFVPPVFDMLAEGGFFRSAQDEINAVSQDLRLLEANPELAPLTQALSDVRQAAQLAIEAQRQKAIEARQQRKLLREQAHELDNTDVLDSLNKRLGQESVRDKNETKTLKKHWKKREVEAQDKLSVLNNDIVALSEQRKAMSLALQGRLFDQYQFLNTAGIERSLGDIFKNTVYQVPPAGSGECAAPKLLQYAFKHGMQPLALAEFWWGQPPKSEVRQHQHFYSACQGKCQPILGHMLEGVPMDSNPLLAMSGSDQKLGIVYQDEDMVVVNKPAEFLSVPGKNIEDSVYLRMKQMFPQATGPLIVHRLDMSTSGLMVIALNKKANKRLQKQFIDRTVEKRYLAVVEGLLVEDEGWIKLPLRGDFYDRPRQIVCFEHGKPAETRWEVVSRENNKTRVYLYPKTGRTHQLRVHCAHVRGLAMPMVGDDLYGVKADRLHLHAESLSLQQPTTKEPLTFRVAADF